MILGTWVVRHPNHVRNPWQQLRSVVLSYLASLVVSDVPGWMERAQEEAVGEKSLCGRLDLRTRSVLACSFIRQSDEGETMPWPEHMHRSSTPHRNVLPTASSCTLFIKLPTWISDVIWMTHYVCVSNHLLSSKCIILNLSFLYYDT